MLRAWIHNNILIETLFQCQVNLVENKVFQCIVPIFLTVKCCFFMWLLLHAASVLTLDCSERPRPGSSAGFSPYDSFRKSSMDRPKSGTPDKRDSWNVEELGNALDSFRPVTLTISSFFKQVC